MFETLKRLYMSQKLTKSGLENAVKKKWITQDQYEEIIKYKE